MKEVAPIGRTRVGHFELDNRHLIWLRKLRYDFPRALKLWSRLETPTNKNMVKVNLTKETIDLDPKSFADILSRYSDAKGKSRVTGFCMAVQQRFGLEIYIDPDSDESDYQFSTRLIKAVLGQIRGRLCLDAEKSGRLILGEDITWYNPKGRKYLGTGPMGMIIIREVVDYGRTANIDPLKHLECMR